MTGTRLRIHAFAWPIAALAALALIAAAPASAAKLSGKTVLAPKVATFEALADAGVEVAPFGDAKVNKNGIVFPITGGKVNLDDTRAKIEHSGGLTFASESAELTVEDFVVKVGKKNVLKAGVAGGGKTRLADLDLKKAKIKEGKNVVISNVKLLLAEKAAKALSDVFDLPDLTGAKLGTAKVKVTG